MTGLSQSFAATGTDFTWGGPLGVGFTPAVATASSLASAQGIITINAPGVGLDWSWTPTVWSRFLLGFSTLITNATVASRRVGLKLLDASSVQVMEFEQSLAINASQNPQYLQFGVGSAMGVMGAANDGIRSCGVTMLGTLIPPGYTIGTITQSLQTGVGGDQWGSTTILAELWPAGVVPALDSQGPLMT